MEQLNKSKGMCYFWYVALEKQKHLIARFNELVNNRVLPKIMFFWKPEFRNPYWARVSKTELSKKGSFWKYPIFYLLLPLIHSAAAVGCKP